MKNISGREIKFYEADVCSGEALDRILAKTASTPLYTLRDIRLWESRLKSP